MFVQTIVSFEKNQTTKENQSSTFNKIVLMQFVSISLLVFVLHFDWLGINFLGFIPVFNGQYRDIEQDWFVKVGLTIVLANLLMVIASIPLKLVRPLGQLVFRCFDRGCKAKLYVDDYPDVRTKKKN